jgi:hypothetical protein
MFAKISLNHNDNPGKQSNELSMKSKAHNYSLGRDEWQQKWETTNKILFPLKPVINSKINIVG